MYNSNCYITTLILKTFFDHNTNKTWLILTYQQHIQDMTTENLISLSTAPFHCLHPSLKVYLLTEIKSGSMMSTKRHCLEKIRNTLDVQPKWSTLVWRLFCRIPWSVTLRWNSAARGPDIASDL